MDYFNQIHDIAPISGGVVQDSSGNILDRVLSSTYSNINGYDNNIVDMSGASGGSGRGENYSYDDYLNWKLENPMLNTLSFNNWVDIMKINDVDNTANNTINDVVRGEDDNIQDDSIEALLKKMIITANEQNQLSYQTAQQVREFNHNEAEIERAWQEKMRDTQIQSTMKQLKEAGINPLLALSGSLSYANASAGASGSASNVSYANDNSIISALIVALAGIASSIFRSNPLMKAALSA